MPQPPFPRFYAIVDSGMVAKSAFSLTDYTRELLQAGVPILQYRNKQQLGMALLAEAREVQRVAASLGSQARLIINDRADLALLTQFHGVHIGQDDISPVAARIVCRPPLWVGISTHNDEQVAAAEKTAADYIAIGPVFPTASKSDPDAVVGLEGVTRARRLTGKPLVAIGGITRQNCNQAIDAGADCVAVISDLLDAPGKSAGEFLRILM